MHADRIVLETVKLLVEIATARESSDQNGHSVVYLDPAFTQVWGDGSSGSMSYMVSPVPRNATVTVPVFARIPARQRSAAGSFSDTLVITLQF